MSNEDALTEELGRKLHSHSLTVRFDQFEDGTICFKLDLDDQVEATSRMIGSDLARLGASRALIGIHALKWCLEDFALNHAISLADNMIEKHGDGVNQGFDPKAPIVQDSGLSLH